MKRMIRALVVCAALAAAMTCSAFAATTDYTTDNDGVVNYDEAEGTYSATYSNATPGSQYVLLVVKGTEDNAPITQDNILYIDQVAADANGKVSFSDFIPKEISDAVVKLGGEFSGASSPVTLGTIKSQYTPGDVDEDGVITASDALMALRIATNNITDPSATQRKAANVDHDSVVTASDALLILRRATNNITAFP